MMRAPAEFKFTLTAPLLAETMMSGTQYLYRGRRGWTLLILGIVLTLLTALGGAAVAILICQMLDVAPTWWMILGVAGGGLLFLFHQQMFVGRMADRAMESGIHKNEQMLRFDSDGLTFLSGDLSWHTPWALIDDVSVSSNTVNVISGGIAFGVPKQSIGTADDVDTFVADLRTQLREA